MGILQCYWSVEINQSAFMVELSRHLAFQTILNPISDSKFIFFVYCSIAFYPYIHQLLTRDKYVLLVNLSEL